MKIVEVAGRYGAVIKFGGVSHEFKRKADARVVASAPDPVWSCRPRRGCHVISVDGPGFGLRHIVEPGESWTAAIYELSREYMQWLGLESRKPRVNRGW